MSFFKTFKSIMSVAKTLSISYLLTIWCFLSVHSWASDLQSKGYFIIRHRGHFSTFEGDGAFMTIYTMKYIGMILLIVSLFYTFSAAKFLFEYRKPIDYYESSRRKRMEYSKYYNKVFDSIRQLKDSLKTYYFILWSMAIVLIYNYLKLDSIIAFVSLSLPFLIISLFLPLALIEVWIQKKRNL